MKADKKDRNRKKINFEYCSYTLTTEREFKHGSDTRPSKSALTKYLESGTVENYLFEFAKLARYLCLLYCTCLCRHTHTVLIYLFWLSPTVYPPTLHVPSIIHLISLILRLFMWRLLAVFQILYTLKITGRAKPRDEYEKKEWSSCSQTGKVSMGPLGKPEQIQYTGGSRKFICRNTR